MDQHQSLAIRLVEMIMVIEMEAFGKGNVQVLPSFKLFYFPNPNPIMLTVKILPPSPL